MPDSMLSALLKAAGDKYVADGIAAWSEAKAKAKERWDELDPFDPEHLMDIAVVSRFVDRAVQAREEARRARDRAEEEAAEASARAERDEALDLGATLADVQGKTEEKLGMLRRAGTPVFPVPEQEVPPKCEAEVPNARPCVLWQGHPGTHENVDHDTWEDGGPVLRFVQCQARDIKAKQAPGRAAPQCSLLNNHPGDHFVNGRHWSTGVATAEDAVPRGMTDGLLHPAPEICQAARQLGSTVLICSLPNGHASSHRDPDGAVWGRLEPMQPMGGAVGKSDETQAQLEAQAAIITKLGQEREAEQARQDESARAWAAAVAEWEVVHLRLLRKVAKRDRKIKRLERQLQAYMADRVDP